MRRPNLVMVTTGVAFVAACGASSPDTANSMVPVAGGTLALGVPRGATRDVEFSTTPHAACTLRLASAPVGVELKLYSDSRGVVRFRFEQPSTGDMAENDTYALECRTDSGDFRRDLFEVASAESLRDTNNVP